MSAATFEQKAVAYVRRLEEHPTKNKSYQRFPLGQAARDFLAYFRTEYGATPSTLRDYEAILARLSIHFGHLEAKDLDVPEGTHLLRRFIDEGWGAKAPATRKKVRAVLVSFSDFLVDEGILLGNPARPIRSPRKRGVERGTFSPDDRERLIAGQGRTRDRIAVRLVFALALRKSELGAIQFKHFDFARRRLIVFGKGGTVTPMPVQPIELCDAVERYMLVRNPEEYLLFPEKRGPRMPGGPTEVLWDDRLSPMSSTTLHRWWVGCLERAGLKHQTMHEARHTAITDLLRSSGNLKLAQQFARHVSIQTTADVYSHLDDVDLERAMAQMYSDRGDA